MSDDKIAALEAKLADAVKRIAELEAAGGGPRAEPLPPPSECPEAGAAPSGPLKSAEPVRWFFLGTHLANLDFWNEHMTSQHRTSDGAFFEKDAQADASQHVHIGYPVRLRKSAGFMRCWGMGAKLSEASKKRAGYQTMTAVEKVGDERAHDMVGVLVPFKKSQEQTIHHATVIPTVTMADIDWLGVFEPPSSIKEVFVGVLDVQLSPPTPEFPILQTNVDTIIKGALRYGEAFAAEWLDQIMWWESEEGVMHYINDRASPRRPWVADAKAPLCDKLLAEHPPCKVLGKRVFAEGYRADSGDELIKDRGVEFSPPPPLATRPACTNFLVGFGSIIQTQSRAASDPKAIDAAPCRIRPEFGYVREWNFQASTAQICALGLRKVRPGEKGATINGVLFQGPEDMSEFDKRENGYMRVEVPMGMVELLSWHELPPGATVSCYVPYAPSVVVKYGNDPATGFPYCSGPTPPPALLPEEAPGLGLQPPSITHPILQTYIDVCLSGCLEYGEDFAREFIATTFLWTPYWLNERQIARRPWLHCKQYVKIDQLLREGVLEHFKHRKLESEYAMNFGLGR